MYFLSHLGELMFNTLTVFNPFSGRDVDIDMVGYGKTRTM